jgi:carboxypeptidase family protein
MPVMNLLLLASVVASSTGEVTGKVVDPQTLPVRGAQVELRCDATVTRTSTDDSGRFVVHDARSQTTCVLSITREGFAPITQRIEPGTTGILLLRLRLAAVKETVSVVATAPELRQPIGSASIESDRLVQLFGRTEDMIRYAALLGGSGITGTSVYVDGMPVTVMPSPELVGRIKVNSEPFSAEYGDGDVTQIQIVTRPATRRLRISPGGSFLAFGGGDGLREGLRSQSSSGSLAVSGGVPRIPLTIAGNLQTSEYEREVAVLAVVSKPTANALGVGIPSDDGISRGTTRSGTISGFYSPAASMRAHVAYAASRSRSSNVGVGGLVLPEAGLGISASSRAIHVSTGVIRGQLAFESGFVARDSASLMNANTFARGLSVAGSFVGGGASIASQRSNRLTWTAKEVVRSSSSHPVAAGVEVSGSSQSYVQVPNALGVVEFESQESFEHALAGQPTATFHVGRGNGSVDYDGVTVAPFVQKTLVRGPRLQIEGGVRADYQSRIGVSLSPRLWAATEWRGLSVQGGGGLFTTFVPSNVFVTAISNDGYHLHQYVSVGTSLSNADAGLTNRDIVATTLAPDLQASRQLMERVAVSRRAGHFVPSVEYTLTRDVHRLGADRLATGDGWIDVVESNRSATRHRVKASLQYQHRAQSVTAHYEWLHAYDDGEGPFSYPERQGRFASEWARTAGLAPHSMTLASILTLPHRVVAAVTDTWQSSAPYDITAGVDSDLNGIFNERNGRARNSGDSPSQQLLSVHASRRFEVPYVRGWFGSRFRINLGVHLDNLTAARNYTSIGSVAGSETFGKPLGAMPGRSARFSLSID